MKVKQGMFEHKKLTELNDYFLNLDQRREKGVFFCRINGYNEQIARFIQAYYEEAVRSGVVIEGRIPNPDEKNLEYYGEIMGMDFQLSMGFITAALKKWLPRMNEYQRNNVAGAIYDTLYMLMQNGKNENMLKNAYIKFMCWLYYKFERVVNRLGENAVPSVLYEGTVSRYELLFLSVLSRAGCDIVLLQYEGDDAYRTLDPQNGLSEPWKGEGAGAFPPGYTLRRIREQMREKRERERLCGTAPAVSACTNAWIRGEGLCDIRTPVSGRGSDPRFFYNCFYRLRGVEDRLTYPNELYQFQLELKNSKRKVVIVDGGLPQPSVDEIQQIKRGNYAKADQMIRDLVSNIMYASNPDLQGIVRKAFIDIIGEEAGKEGLNVNRLTGRAVYLLCWLKRYQQLFAGWRMPDIGCFIYFGCCKKELDALFLRMMARLPVDVVVLEPNLNESGCLADALLYEIVYPDSMVLNHYPQQNAGGHIATAAYHAERELDSLMYQDSGIYRNRQYSKAKVVNLQTTYEEISILWNQELKYRPNFSTVDDIVNLPVIMAKVSGVQYGDLSAYWYSIRQLLTTETQLITSVPYLQGTDQNPMKPYATEFFKNGRLQKEKIKNHAGYPYGVLREEMQEHMFCVLQYMIDQKIIRGTFENGTEYTVVSTVLNLEKKIVRMIQNFDFTKKNPKLVYVCTTEQFFSLEDAIMAAFLHMTGFDIVFFVPTGYQIIEKYYNADLMEEHQLGEYMYDLSIPDFDQISSRNNRQKWHEKIFKRGT